MICNICPTSLRGVKDLGESSIEEVCPMERAYYSHTATFSYSLNLLILANTILVSVGSSYVADSTLITRKLVELDEIRV